MARAPLPAVAGQAHAFPLGTVQGYIKHISLPDLAPPNVPSCPMGINWQVSTELSDSSSGRSPCLLLALCLD